MSKPTPSESINKARLEAAEAASLTRLAFSRERLTSQLYAASWAITAAAVAAQEGDLSRARNEATRASALTYAALGTSDPIHPLLDELGVPRG